MAKESIEQRCISVIQNTKKKDEVDDQEIKNVGEIYSNFFKDTDFKTDDNGKISMDPAIIFPTVTRDSLTDHQQSTLDKILNQMRVFWNRKYNIDIRIGHPKKKHPRAQDETKTSPVHQKAKVENQE